MQYKTEQSRDRMIIRIIALLFVARTCMAVTVNIHGVVTNCSLNCVCCKGGRNKCYSDYRCSEGCVDTIYGHRCHNACKGNCYTCEQNHGTQCYTCKAEFYDIANLCNERCSVGCDDGTCDDNGNCSPCTATFAGNKCDTCKRGFTGSSCTECTTGYYGIDCKQCPSGCRNENCMTDGTCYQCIDKLYGTNCNKTCSEGCRGGACNQDGSCICKEHFTGTKCETCKEGKYGNDCQHTCSVGCVTSTCDRNTGSCACRPNFTGATCEQCNEDTYGQSCDLHCSDKCRYRKCEKGDGACTFGCVAGYSAYFLHVVSVLQIVKVVLARQDPNVQMDVKMGFMA
ncbi:protein draper-like [Mya arenaria]|uniref:protein draper-like n=1 Tax=Mya arenaria TaxID=6604 RepID=UPI0022E95B9F|nr:protein draper-like [Mya arenaria]